MAFYWWSHWFWITSMTVQLLFISQAYTYPSQELKLEQQPLRSSSVTTKLYQTTASLTWSTTTTAATATATATATPSNIMDLTLRTTEGTTARGRTLASIQSGDDDDDDKVSVADERRQEDDNDNVELPSISLEEQEQDEQEEEKIEVEEEGEGDRDSEEEHNNNNSNNDQGESQSHNQFEFKRSADFIQSTEQINNYTNFSSSTSTNNSSGLQWQQQQQQLGSSSSNHSTAVTMPTLITSSSSSSLSSGVTSPASIPNTTSGALVPALVASSTASITSSSSSSIDETNPSISVSVGATPSTPKINTEWLSDELHRAPFTLENVNAEDELRRAESEHRSRKSKVLSAEYKHINRYINFSSDTKSLLTRSASTAPNIATYEATDEGNISSEALAIQRTYFLDAGAISAICFTVFGICCTVGTIGIVLYRRRYLNKPQALSEPDSSVYIDDSTMRDNSDEMYSLDNDSFLNSLEAMTIQNYWTDTVKHTKL